MKIPFEYSENIPDNLKNKDKLNYCIYLQNDNLQSENCLCINVNNSLNLYSFYSKIYIKDKSYELDVKIRKVRSFLKEKFVMIDENHFLENNIHIELCVSPKLRDANGVVKEKKYNSAFIIIYSEYEKSKMTFKQFHSIQNLDKKIIEKTNNLEIFDYFDFKKMFKLYYNLLLN